MQNNNLFSAHAEICKVFTNEIRLKIIEALKEDEKSVNEITEELNEKQPVVSQNLGILRDEDLVETRREGTHIYYSIADDRVFEAFDLIRQIIEDR